MKKLLLISLVIILSCVLIGAYSDNYLNCVTKNIIQDCQPYQKVYYGYEQVGNRLVASQSLPLNDVIIKEFLIKDREKVGNNIIFAVSEPILACSTNLRLEYAGKGYTWAGSPVNCPENMTQINEKNLLNNR